jgi:hypothetical protein
MAVMLTRRPASYLFATGLLTLTLTVAGCGGKDKPAVCGDVDTLQSSISSLTDIKVEQGALDQLKTKLTQVQTDAEQLKSDASSQFGTEITAVETAASGVKTALDAAVATPSASTIAAVVATLPALKTALSNLQSAVESTC